MYTALRVLTPPAAEPVTTAIASQHCRIDNDDDVNLLALYITVARQLAEDYLSRALLTQQLQYSISDAPPGPQWPLTAVTPVVLPMWLPYPLVFQQPIRLPREPVQSIDQVSVSHWGRLTDQILSPATDYSYDLTGAPARLLLQPTAQPEIGQHVLINFTAGYPDPATIPAPVVHAILLATAYLFEHRGDDDASMPEAFFQLLTPHRLVSFGWG